jgi:hypothetical protein
MNSFDLGHGPVVARGRRGGRREFQGFILALLGAATTKPSRYPTLSPNSRSSSPAEE